MRQFLIDYNLGEIWRSLLLAAEPDLCVLRVGDPGCPLADADDSEILIWIEDNDFILITNDLHTMPDHLQDHLAAGRHVPGILTTTKQEPRHEIIDNIILAAGAGFPDEFRDLNRYLPVN